MLKKHLLLSAVYFAGLGGISSVALAQGAAAPAASTEEVVVTGSRLGVAAVNTPTPVTEVTAQQLTASSPGAIADAINNLPALQPGGGQASNAGSTTTAKNTLNLRALGANRTLTLVDGVRFPSTQNGNTVDTNLLPQALVKRVDIVTGGASASYGSDAVSGAINFILDNHFEGFGANLNGGISEYGDGEEVHGSMNFGRAFFGGKMHVTGSVDYFDNFGAKANTRPWEHQQANMLSRSVNGVTNFYFVPDSRNTSSYYGYVKAANLAATATAAQKTAATAAFAGTQFNNAGQIIPFDTGTPGLSNGTFQSGGDGVNTSDLNLTSRPLRRRTAFLRGDYDFSDTLSGYVELMWGHSDGEQENGEFDTVAGFPLTIQTGTTPATTNPYLNTTTLAKLQSLGVTSLTLTKYFNEKEFDYLNNDRATNSVVIGGLNGRIFDRFNWGASGNYGYTREITSTTNSLNLAKLMYAANAVTNPTNGAPICNVTLDPTKIVALYTAAAVGCVPINIFGTGNITQGALNYITDHNPVVYQNETIGTEIHINGPLFDLPAGPVIGATGLEYRRQFDVETAGAASNNKEYQLGATSSFSGGYDVSEGFMEVQFPILGESAISKSLDFNIAGRETYYSTTKGYSFSWKTGIVYKPIDEVTFRTTISRDIRAPNPSELFSNGGQGTANLQDPFPGTASANPTGVKTITVGNLALKPEKGTTVTAGIAYTPDWAPGLSATVDVYDIRVSGVIAGLGAQNIINFCFQGLTAYCSSIQRAAPPAGFTLGAISAVTTSNTNLNALRTNGVDFEIDYAVPGEDWFDWWQGNLQIRSLANFLGIRTTVSGVGAQNQFAALTSPKWKLNTTLNYDLDEWSTFLQIRFIGTQKWSTANNPKIIPFQTADWNQVNTATYFDFQEAYHINPNMTVSLNVQNLFDLKPQFLPSNSNYGKVTDESQFDTMGRYFRIAVRVKY